jgi:hypothetical protein
MQYILTEEEYQDLKKSNPDQLLRDTNTQLKAKLDEFEASVNNQPKTTVSKVSHFDSPFIVTNEHLCLRSPTDFIILFNSLAEPTLSESDKALFEYVTNLAIMFNYKPQFAEQRDLKAYRVSLQKKQLCNKVVKDGKCYLEFPNITKED